eukprot:750657-Hanusia_phi.AAC.4
MIGCDLLTESDGQRTRESDVPHGSDGAGNSGTIGEVLNHRTRTVSATTEEQPERDSDTQP